MKLEGVRELPLAGVWHYENTCLLARLQTVFGADGYLHAPRLPEVLHLY